MRAAVGILAVSCHLPQHKRSVEDLFREEGANFSADVAARLGIKQVPIRNGDASETASNMAVAAGREALQSAKVDPLTVDVVVEYSPRRHHAVSGAIGEAPLGRFPQGGNAESNE